MFMLWVSVYICHWVSIRACECASTTTIRQIFDETCWDLYQKDLDFFLMGKWKQCVNKRVFQQRMKFRYSISSPHILFLLYLCTSVSIHIFALLNQDMKTHIDTHISSPAYTHVCWNTLACVSYVHLCIYVYLFMLIHIYTYPYMHNTYINTKLTHIITGSRVHTDICILYLLVCIYDCAWVSAWMCSYMY